jgi:hypothetical protein
MNLNWREATLVELADGYQIAGDQTLTNVHVACEGAFLHVRVPGTPDEYLISAPALHHLTYALVGQT